jgi:hypothetical protein
MWGIGIGAAALLGLALAGCNAAVPSGSVGPDIAKQTVRDVRSDPAEFAVVLTGTTDPGVSSRVVTVVGVSLHSSTAGWVTIPMSPHPVDLVALRDGTDVLATTSLPEGTVTEVKLQLDPGASSRPAAGGPQLGASGARTVAMAGRLGVRAAHHYELTLELALPPVASAQPNRRTSAGADAPHLHVVEFRDRDRHPQDDHDCPGATDAGTDPAPMVTTLTVPATADIYAAGLQVPPAVSCGDNPDADGESLPPGIAVSGGSVVTFSSVTGGVKCVDYVNENPPEGPCFSGDMGTHLLSSGGISGIVDGQSNMFLSGVFTNESARSASAPDSLDFSAGALGHDFVLLSPGLQQQFFIGDGLTSAGVLQQFIAPAGATTLYLGFADGYNFNGTPGCYQDNYDALSATVSVQPMHP